MGDANTLIPNTHQRFLTFRPLLEHHLDLSACRAVLDSIRENIREHLFNAFATLSVKASTEVARAILYQAETSGVDKNGDAALIALATHGREGMLRCVVGSTAQYIYYW